MRFKPTDPPMLVLEGKTRRQRKWTRLRIKHFMWAELLFKMYEIAKKDHPGNDYRVLVMPENWRIL